MPADLVPLTAAFVLKQNRHNFDRMVLTLRPHLLLHRGLLRDMAGNDTRRAHLIQKLTWIAVCIKNWRGIHDNIYLSAFSRGLGCHQTKNQHFDPGLEGHEAKSLHLYMDLERHDA